jgi:hypothetical protein
MSTATTSLQHCPKCGSWMQITSAGNKCPMGCDGHTVFNFPLYDELIMPPAREINTPYDGTFGRHGWICPKCGRGCSPYVNYCDCGGFDKWDVTCNSQLATTPGKVNSDENSNYGSATTGSSNCTTLCK